jgi:hypothetical protein
LRKHEEIFCRYDETFGLTHYEELRVYMELPKGIPSHDVFGDVFSRIDCEAVLKCFVKWLSNLKKSL